MSKVTTKTSNVKIVECPNCKQMSLVITDIPVTMHKQCVRCGYAEYKDYGGLDENDEAIIIKMTAKQPIGCATLKYIDEVDESIISIPELWMYKSFIEYLIDNKDAIEYCKLSSFKDDAFIETDLMKLI